jgi:hypothetical protein
MPTGQGGIGSVESVGQLPRVLTGATAISPSHTFDADWDGPIVDELRKCAANLSPD